MSRDPERTRARILSAAMREFVAKGFAGARVDAIARRARVNKRMLYHYYGSKRGLFEAALLERLRNKQRAVAAAPSGIEELLAFYFALGGNDRGWMRLLLWEALDYTDKPVIAEKERAEGLRRGVARVRALQERGELEGELEPDLVLLAMIALCMFPWALPQMVRLVVGESPTSPRFRRGYARLLRSVGASLRAGAKRNPSRAAS